jgi:DNA-directed RNA polymerase specialized sigma24 family protein
VGRPGAVATREQQRAGQQHRHRATRHPAIVSQVRPNAAQATQHNGHAHRLVRDRLWQLREQDVEFDEFTRTGLRPLLQFVRVLTGDRGLAEDIVQEVLIRLHARSDRLEEIENLGAYARRMAVNEYVNWAASGSGSAPPPCCTNRRRTRTTRTVTPTANGFASNWRSCLDGQRAVLALRYYAGLTDAEIADELGCSAGTVRSHASRGLATLRVEMSEAPLNAQESLT